MGVGTSWLRRRLDVRDVFRLNRNSRYLVLAAGLVLSLLAGVAAFEWVSPIALLHRELIYGIGMGWMAILGVFVFDLFVLKHGWCGHLCPLGAFYALAGGQTAQVKVRFDQKTCTHCGECALVCSEPTEADPEDVDALPRSFPGAPPLIPHEIKPMMAVMAVDNQCLECHDKPRYVSKDVKDKAPMPKGHYAVVPENASGRELSGARFNCNQDHVLQSDAKPLVSNIFVNVAE